MIRRTPLTAGARETVYVKSLGRDSSFSYDMRVGESWKQWLHLRRGGGGGVEKREGARQQNGRKEDAREEFGNLWGMRGRRNAVSCWSSSLIKLNGPRWNVYNCARQNFMQNTKNEQHQSSVCGTRVGDCIFRRSVDRGVGQPVEGDRGEPSKNGGDSRVRHQTPWHNGGHGRDGTGNSIGSGE